MTLNDDAIITNDLPEDSQHSVDQHWMQRALELAAYGASLGEVPVGAVVVRDGIIIGEGWNQPISSHDPSAHAEIVAIRDAAKRVNNYRLPNTTLYVTLEPCTMCAGVLVHARIERLVYAATEPKSGVIHSNSSILDASYFNHQVVYTQGVLKEQSQILLRDFFRNRRANKKNKNK